KFEARCRRGPMRRVTMSRSTALSPFIALASASRDTSPQAPSNNCSTIMVARCGCPAAYLPDCPTDPSGICPRRSSEPEIAGCFQADNPPAFDPAQEFGYWPEPRQRTKLLLPWETRSSNSDCVSPNLCCRGCVFKNKKRTYLVGAELQFCPGAGALCPARRSGRGVAHRLLSRVAAPEPADRGEGAEPG